MPSYDLNWEQLAAMLKRCEPSRFEVVVHQHMPMFHMEHCVFAALLSDGKDWRDCGRPCDTHRVALRDRVGAEFPLMADTGCRNTVFNSVAQSAAEFVPRMLSLGVRHFRVELLRESAAELVALVDRYARVLAGLETWPQHLAAIAGAQSIGRHARDAAKVGDMGQGSGNKRQDDALGVIIFPSPGVPCLGSGRALLPCSGPLFNGAAVDRLRKVAIECPRHFVDACFNGAAVVRLRMRYTCSNGHYRTRTCDFRLVRAAL